MEIVFQDDSQRLISVPDDMEDSDDPEDKKETSFASNKRRRVELETRKRQQEALNRSPIAGGGQPQQAKQKTPPKEKTKKTLTQDTEGVEYAQGATPLKLPFAPTPSAKSLLPQYIKEQLPPGVRLGEVTALNTDQHLFYNFHHRLLSRFVPHWGNLVGIAVRRWIDKEGTPKTSKTWVTNVEVIMDPNGEVLDVQHYRLSGYWPIDEAPSKAFSRHVKRIPNPPTQMVDENGYIRLKFQTEVHWVPQAPPRRFNSDSRRKSY